jgi:hypothetical protein
MVYSKQLQATPIASKSRVGRAAGSALEATAGGGVGVSDHLDGLTGLREFGRRRRASPYDVGDITSD